MNYTLVDLYNCIDDFRIDLQQDSLNKASIDLMMELMSYTNEIVGMGGSRRTIWLKVEDENREERWINVTVYGRCYKPDDIFYQISVEGSKLLSYDSKKMSGDGRVDATSILSWLIDRVKEVITLAADGKYEDYISTVPYNRRRGVISRRDYYAIVPQAKKKYESALTKEEKEELFLSEGTTDFYEEGMTARRFFEACALVYETLGFPKELEERLLIDFEESEEEKLRYGGITPREWYYSLADGRESGLLALPLDDENAFIGWIRKKRPWFNGGIYGGHEWDFISSLSRDMRMLVAPDVWTDKCRIRIIGDNAVRSTEIIRAFLALRRAGYAVVLDGYKVLTDRIKEADYIGIVEYAGFFDSEDTIAGHEVSDKVCLEDFGDMSVVNKLIEAAEWEKLDEVKLLAKEGEKIWDAKMSEELEIKIISRPGDSI